MIICNLKTSEKQVIGKQIKTQINMSNYNNLVVKNKMFFVVTFITFNICNVLNSITFIIEANLIQHNFTAAANDEWKFTTHLIAIGLGNYVH